MTNVYRLPDQGRATVELEAQRVASWLRRIMAQGDGAGPWSAERLCRKAGTSPTNITRFLKDGYPVPKMNTLAKIAEVAGVPAPDLLLSSQLQPFVDVPIVLPIVAFRRGIGAAIVSAVETTRVPTKFAECAAVKITLDTGSLAGVLLGDLVIFDHRRDPQMNDLVVVATAEGLAGVYRVQGPWLMPQAPGNLPALAMEGTEILGVARQVQRELR